MKKHITAFYLETLVMILVFVGIILILTHIFGIAKVQSTRAKLLTTSVTLAESAAEALASSDSPRELQQLLDQGGNTELDPAGNLVRASYDADMTPNPGGSLTVEILWTPTDTGSGTLVEGDIRVLRPAFDEELYTLHTAAFRKEAGP